jgi:hypothetical protein
MKWRHDDNENNGPRVIAVDLFGARIPSASAYSPPRLKISRTTSGIPFSRVRKPKNGTENTFLNTFTTRFIYDFSDYPTLRFDRCLKRRDGKYVYLESTPSVRAENLPRKYVYSIADMIKEPGVYTWVLYDANKFVAAKNMTPEELYSKHKNVLESIKNDVSLVKLAGECIVHSDKKVAYNLLSGTYMQSHVKRMGAYYNKYYERFRDYFEKLLRDAGAAEVYAVSKTLITDDMIVSDEIIQQYVDAGFVLKEFDSREECNRHMKSWLEARIAAEDMEGGGRRAKTRRRQTRRRQTRRRQTRRRQIK